MTQVLKQQAIFSTPWFDIVAKTISGDEGNDPYYSLRTLDYVSVIALTEGSEVLLVRQYRPAVEAYTLELPSGHVEQGESPDDAARRELLEETGYVANEVELLGCLMPDTGRMSNRSWCYFTSGVKLFASPQKTYPEIQLVRCSAQELTKSIMELKFSHAQNLAALLLALVQNKFIFQKN